ncbi:MAG: SDR family oxidoreductase [Verrucomicrobiota bacterium]
MSARCLIVGCGYVGTALAQQLESDGYEVAGVVYTESSARALREKGWNVFQGDVADSEFWKSLPGRWNMVVYCPSTGGKGLEGYQQIHEQGLKLAFDWLDGQTTFIYTSSTSVYGQTDGEWVNESSETNPVSETAKILVKAERSVLDHGGLVLRLAGIYGEGRGVLLKRLLEGGAMVPEQDPKWLNLIHQADIISAIQYGLSGKLGFGELYNVVDSRPASYREIYHWLCEQLSRSLPPTGTPDYFGKRGLTNKRVSNQKILETGWLPKFPSFQEGYQGMLRNLN